MEFELEDWATGVDVMLGGSPTDVYQRNAHAAVTAAEDRGAPITLVLAWRNRIISSWDDPDAIKAVTREAETYNRRETPGLLDRAAEKAAKAGRELLPSPTSVGMGFGVVLLAAVAILYLTRSRA